MKRSAALALGMLLLSAQGGYAQPASTSAFPNRPIRAVVPLAPGGGTDTVGRLVSAKLGELLGQQIVVDNRGGGGGVLGTDLVAKATPDGYTLLVGSITTNAVNPALYKKLPYDHIRDFAPISMIGTVPNALVVHTSVSAKTLKEFIAFAKTNPGKINYGSAGIGSAPHMGIALISAAAGIEMVHVPFAGLGPATNALVAGTVDVGLVTPPQAKPLADSGAIRVIAVTGNKRYAAIPEVPTLKEAGLNVSTIVGYGLSAPAGTPETVLARLKQGIVDMMNDKALIARLGELGYETDLQLGDAYRDFILKDLEQWRQVGKAANIRIDN